MSLRNLTRGALFVALGILLPIAFHAVGLGKVFLPMHIPVLLAGFFCSPSVGLLAGMITPLLSAVLTGMPPLAPPVAQAMVFELGIYGLLTGFLYGRMRLGERIAKPCGQRPGCRASLAVTTGRSPPGFHRPVSTRASRSPAAGGRSGTWSRWVAGECRKKLQREGNCAGRYGGWPGRWWPNRPWARSPR
ncbi:MAG: ECF transporter S component [Bacillota bacterium]|nr:ECF transporter S component [Bacillota bacterium]